MNFDWIPKRLVGALCSILAIALNRKLGLGLEGADVLAVAGAGAAYVGAQTVHDVKLAALGTGKHAPKKVP